MTKHKGSKGGSTTNRGTTNRGTTNRGTTNRGSKGTGYILNHRRGVNSKNSFREEHRRRAFRGGGMLKMFEMRRHRRGKQQTILVCFPKQ
jgi:hypothetical protein